MNELRHLHPDFDGYATSAMKEAMKKKVLTGRPYGGTGFIWNKKFSDSVKPRVEYQHERVTVLEISGIKFNTICINAYLPYYKTSEIIEQTELFKDTIRYIDHIIDSNPGCRFILLGDFNCNIYNYNHPFTPIVRDLMQLRRLICTYDLIDNFDPDEVYTRRDSRPGSNGSLLDYVFISEELRDMTSNPVICNFNDNFSDHLPILVDIDLSIPVTDSTKTNYRSPTVNWASINDDVKLQYANAMKVHLDSIVIPFHSLLHGNRCCDSNDHISCIENYFCDIVNAISKAEKLLPRSRPGISKDYWNDDLTNLKTASHDAFIIWRDVGKPVSGPVFDLKKNTNYQYKLAVRRAKRSFDQTRSDTIHDNLVTNNNIKFWRSWQSLHGSKDNITTRVNGKIDSTEIANEFAAGFRKIYDDAKSDQADRISANFDSKFRSYCDNQDDYIGNSYLSWDNMETIMSKLEPGKASGSFIKAEHVLYGSPQLTIHLHLLFNAMLQHSYVPTEFLRGVITPIIKDPEGDASSLDNYRGITLSHVFSYLFDHAILLKTDSFLKTDDLQFGYKKRHSTSHAIYTAKRCIDYFCTHGSYVYASFLDCTKGFDRVSHKGLFLKLLERGIPLCFLRILMYWYPNMYSVCKWQDSLSRSFPVISGVRQGGVLSAKFWALYMNELVLMLKKTKQGCHIADLFIACILYADDVCLLAPTRKAMQTLLNTCSEFAEAWCIKYNEKKTKVMYFGKNPESFSCSPLILNNKPLEIVPEWKYLGVTVTSANGFYCSAKKPRSSFYCSANSILNVMHRPSEQVLLKLLYSICVPNLTYACEVATYNSREKESLHVALNDAIRRIFGYNRWESIRNLREAAHYPCVTEIFARRQLSFIDNLPNIGNLFLASLSLIV